MQQQTIEIIFISFLVRDTIPEAKNKKHHLKYPNIEAVKDGKSSKYVTYSMFFAAQFIAKAKINVDYISFENFWTNS